MTLLRELSRAVSAQSIRKDVLELLALIAYFQPQGDYELQRILRGMDPVSGQSFHVEYIWKDFALYEPFNFQTYDPRQPEPVYTFERRIARVVVTYGTHFLHGTVS